MAKISFRTIGKTDKQNIYIELSLERGKQCRRNTGFTIKPNEWSETFKLPKTTNAHLKKLKLDLQQLQNDIENRCNSAVSQGDLINGDWLQLQLDELLGKAGKADTDLLALHCQSYINGLPFKSNGKRQTGASPSTVKKYITIRNKIEAFEKHRKKKIYVKDVDMNFRKEFLAYLTDVEHLASNTCGRYIKFVTTICKDAKIYGIATNPQLDSIKGFTDEVAKIHLTFEEIDQIDRAELVSDSLANARDWLIIGCYIGQRVSDLLRLTTENIVNKCGMDLIELTQQKTGKQVVIPIHPRVRQILDSRGGEFPRKISDQKFNEYIKRVAMAAGIDEPTSGATMKEQTHAGEKMFRKETGVFPKYELVTSHICRRSFASNYYAEMPTSLIIQITGHSTESQFLEYVGKPPMDHAQQIAEYLLSIYQKQQNKPKLEILKAN